MGSEGSTSALTKFWQLDSSDRCLVVQAVLALGIARIQMARYSFEQLSEQLSRHPSEFRATDSSDPVNAADPELLRRVSFAIGAAASHVPWRSDCFPQCIAGRAMLAKEGIPATIHLGVERVGNSDLEGHAWLTCGETVVTGAGADLSRFTELHRYPG